MHLQCSQLVTCMLILYHALVVFPFFMSMKANRPIMGLDKKGWFTLIAWDICY